MMFEQNDGKGQDNIAQNRFTAYLLVSLRNTRKVYLDKLTLIQVHEAPFEIRDSGAYFVYEPDMLESLSVMDQLEDDALRAYLLRVRQRDLHIFIGKVIEGKSLRELSEELGLGFNTVSTAYHRLIRRLRTELRNYGNRL